LLWHCPYLGLYIINDPINGKLEELWKETAVAEYEVLSLYIFGETEEYDKKSQYR
jgi:hypothetical protein